LFSLCVLAMAQAAQAAVHPGLLPAFDKTLGTGAPTMNASLVEQSPAQNTCGVGKWRKSAGQDCFDCPSGWFQDIAGSTDGVAEFRDLRSVCKLCVMGKYQDEEGTSECKGCPLGFQNTGLEIQNKYNYFDGKVGIQDFEWVAYNNTEAERLIGFESEQEVAELRKESGEDTLEDAKTQCTAHGNCVAFCVNTEDITVYYNEEEQGMEEVTGKRCPTKAEILAVPVEERYAEFDFGSCKNNPCGNYGLDGDVAPVCIKDQETAGTWECYKKVGTKEAPEIELEDKMSIDDCEYLCSQDTECMAFDFNELTRKCTHRQGVCFMGTEKPYKGDEDSCPRHCPLRQFWDGEKCADEEPGFIYCTCKQWLKTGVLLSDYKCMPCPNGKIMNDKHHRAPEASCKAVPEKDCQGLCDDGKHWEPDADADGSGHGGCVADEDGVEYCGCRHYYGVAMGVKDNTPNSTRPDACMPCPQGQYIGDSHHNASKAYCIKEPVIDHPIDITGWRDCHNAGTDRCRQGCNGYIKTGECAVGESGGEPFGDPIDVIECADMITTEDTGYCVCDRSKKVGGYGCEPKPYRDCESACLTDYFSYWRAVTGCDPSGPRDILNDREGKVELDKTIAGYCDCEDTTKGGLIKSTTKKVMLSNCDPKTHTYKTCDEACTHYWEGDEIHVETDGTQDNLKPDHPLQPGHINEPEAAPDGINCHPYKAPCEVCEEFTGKELAQCIVRVMECELKPAIVKCDDV